MTIAEELLLLAYRKGDGKAFIGSLALECGLAGALLAELALTERIGLEKGRLVAADHPAPTGDAELDAVLARIAGSPRRHKPEWWVRKLRSRTLRRLFVGRLVSGGLVRPRTRHVVGLFPVTRYPAADPTARDRVEALLRAAIGGAPPDPRTAALAALVHAVGLDRKVFADLPRAVLKRRMRGITAGDCFGKAVHDVIRSIQSGAAVAAGAAGAAAAASG